MEVITLIESPKRIANAKKLMHLYPQDMEADTFSDTRLRGLLCDFLAGVLAVVQARIEEDVEAQVFRQQPEAQERILTLCTVPILPRSPRLRP